jgi:hypothetical protein
MNGYDEHRTLSSSTCSDDIETSSMLVKWFGNGRNLHCWFVIEFDICTRLSAWLPSGSCCAPIEHEMIQSRSVSGRYGPKWTSVTKSQLEKLQLLLLFFCGGSQSGTKRARAHNTKRRYGLHLTGPLKRTLPLSDKLSNRWHLLMTSTVCLTTVSGMSTLFIVKRVWKTRTGPLIALHQLLSLWQRFFFPPKKFHN